MRERPILFNPPMIRAVLDGRKTQTRRVVKPELPPEALAPVCESGWWMWQRFNAERRHFDGKTTDKLWDQRCPYGQPGDRLWVRETWMDLIGTGIERSTGDRGRYAYAADTPPGSYGDEARKGYGLKWRPSIHMPRWASRITLEITGVRVERLRDISPYDAIAEGLRGITKDGSLVKYGIPDKDGLPGTDDTGWPWYLWRISPVDAYQKLWESINGPGSWALNPWVWVIEFRRMG
jgi:hypothetical protein